MTIHRYFPLLLCVAASVASHAQSGAQPQSPPSDEVPADSLSIYSDLDEVVVTPRKRGLTRLRGTATGTERINASELKRAACCNLGESFSTSPSVDVNYSDAATGARQIKLLGLLGTYVQNLTENIPNLRGAGAQYGLSYIPGPWMESIQVSKGASSVKNGYESVTGQINVEMLKPQTDPSLSLNVFADHMGKLEANAAGNIHLSGKLSSALLLHGENSFATHDENGDGFADSPAIRQFSVMNRWAHISDSYIFQAAAKYLDEKRESGQTTHHAANIDHPYQIDITTRRGEAWVKNAYMFNDESGGNVALIVAGSVHSQKGNYGHRVYNVNQKNLYGSLMFERDFGTLHSLSVGLSVNIDSYRQSFRLARTNFNPLLRLDEDETTPGGYTQYTFNLNSQLIVMGGVRYDHSSIYGNMFTPRVHARWNVADPLSIHISAGKGYRTPHALADNSHLLASSREIIIAPDLQQEEAWNFGGGLSGTVSLFDRDLSWNTEYYYTDFRHQAIVDFDRSPAVAYIGNLPGKSLSHALQADITFQLLDDLTVTAAYRYNDVKVDYGRGLTDKPLTSRSKGLFSIGYSPMMGIWQFDVTLGITGGGRMPAPKFDGSTQLWDTRYKAFPTLNAQITRNFRHWSIYLGGENLTGYRQKTPVIGADNPWGDNFDATMVYGPVQGAMAYVGVRYTFTKY